MFSILDKTIWAIFFLNKGIWAIIDVVVKHYIQRMSNENLLQQKVQLKTEKWNPSLAVV